jgi:hypothetical protein
MNAPRVFPACWSTVINANWIFIGVGGETKAECFASLILFFKSFFFFFLILTLGCVRYRSVLGRKADFIFVKTTVMFTQGVA